MYAWNKLFCECLLLYKVKKAFDGNVDDVSARVEKVSHVQATNSVDSNSTFVIILIAVVYKPFLFVVWVEQTHFGLLSTRSNARPATFS